MASNIQSWSETYERLKLYHDMAYLKIDEALKKEEQNVKEDFPYLPALHSAAANNQCKVVHSLLQTGTNINSVSRDGSTALHIAALNGHLAMVALLLLLEANVNASNNSGSTPLNEALGVKKFGVAELLIKSGGNIRIKDVKNQKLLFYLLKVDAPLSTIKLVVNSANVNAKEEGTGRNVLHVIAEMKTTHSLELAKCLIENGAEIDVLNKSNYTALHIASITGNLQLAELLLDQGADIDAVSLKRTTPLHFAIDNCRLDVATLLIDRGANINAVDITNWTPLHFSAATDSSEIAKKVIQLGAETEVEENQCKGTPLHLAVRYGNFNTVKILVSHGANVNAKMLDSFTPLHLGAQNGNECMVTYLLENGSHFDDKSGAITNLYPYDFALKLHNVKVVSILLNVKQFFNAVRNKNIEDIKKSLKNGVPINCKSVKYKSALIYASWKGYSDIVTVLLDEGADVNISDDNNMSALHYASKFGHSTIVSILLNHGAIFNIVSKREIITPLQFAKESKVPEIIDLLEVIDRQFENVANGKLEVIQELAEIKKKFPHKFYTINNAVNRDKKNLLEVGFASSSKEIANSLLKMLH